ncbi:MAG: DUF362 domain-containing protein [Desulfovibrionaceae bacterium]|nr:DUF362 domain-containing protein [Desulfovibrionaceae bacterium]
MSISRRSFVKGAAAAVGAAAAGILPQTAYGGNTSMNTPSPRPGTGGDIYVPYSQRGGAESDVWFTRDLSAEGLRSIFSRVSGALGGKIAIKLHTGEKNGPNIIPRPWVQELIAKDLPGAHIVETNAYYQGDRYTTDKHRETLKVNGWTFAPVDIMDEHGTAMLPVKGGKWFTEMSVGKGLLDYDSLLVLTHFKGHVMGGFGGSNKNIGIGCADGRIGKAMIHTAKGKGQWSITAEEFMERMTESSKATVDHFAPRIVFITVLRNMSVSCDCEGTAAAPVVTPNIGIVASRDILAVDQASVDLVHALPEKDKAALMERMTTRHGFRQLSYMQELGMGNVRYNLLDIDNNGARILPKDAVAGVKPFSA